MSTGAKILVIDDDRDLVETLRVLLAAKGYNVVSAYDATSGLEKTRSERPDLILLDVMMPNATEGFHLVWKLRQDPDESLRNTAIIVISAIHEKTDLRFYPDGGDGTYQAGEFLPVQDFVDKPIDPAKLLERIERVLTAWRKK
ncbi:MAG: response regulator [Acidobacteriota bacterium]